MSKVPKDQLKLSLDRKQGLMTLSIFGWKAITSLGVILAGFLLLIRIISE